MDGSEFSLLNSPALKTLFGRLPLVAGEPAPPGPVEPGLLLSPATRIEDIYLSSSSRFSARFGVGAMSYDGQLLFMVSRMQPTSFEPPTLCRTDDISLVRCSLYRFSSASLDLFAAISSLRCCIIVARHAHIDGQEERGSWSISCFRANCTFASSVKS